MRMAELLRGLTVFFAIAFFTSASAQETQAFKIEHSFVLPIESKLLGRRYEAYVKIPPGYDAPENQHRRYPVLYMTDGAYTFQVASGVTMVPFNHDRLKEFILVGISNAVDEAPGDARRRDLTPWKVLKYAAPSGGAPDFLNFVKNEFMPVVESRFRIDPQERVLAGQSYGGLFGLWVAFTEPGLFGSYILTSPSIWYADHAILAAETRYARTHRDLKAKRYFAVGQMEVPGECKACTGDMVGDSRNWWPN